MSYIIAVLGYSDSGKDSVATMLNKVLGARNIKWSAPMKHMLEYVYNLPEGILEDKTFRSTLVPGHPDSITWSELMVRCFEYFPKIDPHMMLQRVRLDIKTCLQNSTPVVLTDTRNLTEVHHICQLSAITPLYTVALSRDEAKMKPSDRGLNRNLSELVTFSRMSFHINNNGSLEDLQATVNKLITKIEHDYYNY